MIHAVTGPAPRAQILVITPSECAWMTGKTTFSTFQGSFTALAIVLFFLTAILEDKDAQGKYNAQ